MNDYYVLIPDKEYQDLGLMGYTESYQTAKVYLQQHMFAFEDEMNVYEYKHIHSFEDLNRKVKNELGINLDAHEDYIEYLVSNNEKVVVTMTQGYMNAWGVDSGGGYSTGQTMRNIKNQLTLALVSLTFMNRYIKFDRFHHMASILAKVYLPLLDIELDIDECGEMTDEERIVEYQRLVDENHLDPASYESPFAILDEVICVKLILEEVSGWQSIIL